MMKSFVLALTMIIFTASAASATDQRRLWGLRETVGSVQISGWETGLVKTNPNLGHWHWTPMYANIQRIHTYEDPNPAKDATKTKRGATPVLMVASVPSPHYVKPTKVPLPVPQWQKELAKFDKVPLKPPASDSNSSSHSNISGKFLNTNGPPSVASYGFDYGQPNAQLSERTSVHGRLRAQHI